MNMNQNRLNTLGIQYLDGHRSNRSKEASPMKIKTQMRSLLKAIAAAGLIFQAATAHAAADNRYCGPGDVPSFGTSDGPASLPNRCVYTGMPNTSGYAVKTVCHAADGSCDFTTLASAVAAATCGEIIKIKARDSAGKQIVYDEHAIAIAKQCSAAGWIIVASDLYQDSNFPAEGSRITPAWDGITSLTARPAYAQPAVAGIYIPKIRASVSNASVFRIAGASYWRFIGLELTSVAGVTQSSLVGADPNITGLAGDHMIFDRLVMHGGDSPIGENATEVGRGLSGGQQTNMGLIDSYLFDFICTANACSDSQAVTLGGNQADMAEGPSKIVNNFLEASGENIFAGGGGTGAGCCQIASNFEIRRNNLYKPALIWQKSFPNSDPNSTCNGGKDTGCTDNPSFYGTSVIVKNLGEFKTGRLILIEGNVFENNWGGQSDQFGNALNFNPVSQNSHVSGCADSDGAGTLTAAACAGGTGKPIQFRPEAVNQYCPVPFQCRVTMGAKPDRANYSLAQTYVSASQITVAPALAAFTGQVIAQCIPGLNPLASSSDSVVRFNIFRHSARGIAITTDKSQCGDLAKELARFSLHDNQFDDIDGWKWNLKKAACCAWGAGIKVGNVSEDQATATQSVMIAHNTILTSEEYNAGEEGSVNISNTCGPNCSVIISNIVIRDNLGAGGIQDNGGVQRDPCNASHQDKPSATLLNCLTGASAPNWCMTGNALANGTLPSLPAPSGNTPWPTSSPSCPGGVSTFNFNPTDYTSFGMANLNNANGGDYHLLASSPYHKAASDGKDIGADIDLINLYTGGGGVGYTITPAPYTGVSANGLTANWTSSYPTGTFYYTTLSTGALPNSFAGNKSSNTFNTSATWTTLSANTTYYGQVSTAAAGPFTSLASAKTLAAGGTITAAPYSGVSANGLTANWTTTFGQGTLYYATLSTGTLPNAFSGNLSSNTFNTFATWTSLSAGTIYYGQVSTAAAGPFTALGSTKTLTGGGGSPVITSTLTASAVKGSPFSYQITATNNPTSFNATGLPAGVTVNTGTGLISGTPTASGSFSVAMSATNSGGTGTATLALAVNSPAPVITSALTATVSVGTAFSYQITASNNPTSFNAAGLPAGLTVNTGSGLISGTPTSVGASTVTLSATNSSGTGTAALALAVNDTTPPAVSIVFPQTGALVARIATLVAAASDNVKVASVQFKIDGKNIGIPATAADPYTCYPAPIVNPMQAQTPYCATGDYSARWDTTTSTNGLHVLTATAVDASGNATTSAPVTVRVLNLWVRLSWDPINPDTARLGLETADPAFPNAPTVTASIQLPSGMKTATLTRISTAPVTYDLGLPGVSFSSADFFSLNGALPSVTVGTQTFTAMGLGGAVTPTIGGRILEPNGAAQVTVLPGGLTQEAQIVINPMPAGFYAAASAASAASSGQNLKLLDSGRDIVMATSGTLTGALLALPFDAALIPAGHTLADVRIAYFNAGTGHWEIQGNASVAGGVVSAHVLHFSPYAPVVVMASAAPGLNAAVVYPNPVVPPADPTIRVCPGIVDSVDITIFDVSGRVVHSATIAGSASFTPAAGEGAGQFCYEHVWTGSKASGVYHAVVHAKAGGTTVKARLSFAVVR